MDDPTSDDDPPDLEPIPETREPSDPDYPILDDDDVEEETDVQ
jgi:hypothetical protein